MPRLPKKVIRALTADESLERYFRLRESELRRDHAKRIRLLSVQRDCGTHREAMQVRKVFDTPEGVVVIVL